MITTIFLIIVLIKLISFKGFLFFLSAYSVIYLMIKFLNDESSSKKQKIQMGVRIKYRKQNISTLKKGNSVAAKNPVYKDKTSMEQKGKQDDLSIQDKKVTDKNHFIKSTITIKKIIVKKTLSSSKDVLIVKKSKIMRTKKIVTIKPALI